MKRVSDEQERYFCTSVTQCLQKQAKIGLQESLAEDPKFFCALDISVKQGMVVTS